MSKDTGDTTGGKDDKPTWNKDPLAGIIAVILLAAFAGLILYFLKHLDMAEPKWSRATYLFGSVEAIVFAAIGWLFGKEVHREQAQQAEERADRNQQTAEAGFALARAVKAKQVNHSARVQGFSNLSNDAFAPLLQADLNELGYIADEVLVQHSG